MSLIHCKECNSEVSTDAYDCPKCGAKLRKPKRTIFGYLCFFSFIGFNLLMIIWSFSYVVGISKMLNTTSSDAERTGATIGSGIGIMFILIVWLCGAGITGLMTLLTRPKKY